MMTSAPKRRWLWFTLFTGITVLVISFCWIASEAMVVSERKQVRMWLGTKPGYYHNLYTETDIRTLGYVPEELESRDFTISPLRRLMGDEGVAAIWAFGLSEAELARVQSAFPEATLHLDERSGSGYF